MPVPRVLSNGGVDFVRTPISILGVISKQLRLLDGRVGDHQIP